MEKFPHRVKLRTMLAETRDLARSQARDADAYSAKQLERYADEIQKQIDTVSSMREDHEPDSQ